MGVRHLRLAFDPFPLFADRHAQTIIASQISLAIPSPSTTRVIALPDGDQLALEVSTPSTWQPTDPTVVLIHGLCGCHASPYMIRMAHKLWSSGIRAVRMNMRGCGSGDSLARQPYHSGRSGDVLAVLADLRHVAPQSPVTAIGFSLGGNLLLKLAGELQTGAATYLKQAIAVSPPADLAASVRTFSQPSNRVYEWRFIRLLKVATAARHARFPDLPAISLPKRLSLYEFDNLYTAPLCGFADADDYYARSSAAPLVPQISIPCRILFAADDPLIDTTTFDAMTLPSNIQVYHTLRGGHLGFLGIPGRPGGYRWMDAQLLDWVRAALPTSALT
jgi:hypothetical protein